ncbi:Lactoylglutathione lyase / glyoxalase I family protein [Rhynchospora pubera]|uniref:Lactoylglutathione lyase / glyoxalase I family protein n=1 Tax=Rhynchospora pubera TaxID=906938 RepID=A0AAV8CBT8_9POAL|nr:Lactoylglutathione lyase / glyoxalase I family protein [Rhynchospora pubera]
MESRNNIDGALPLTSLNHISVMCQSVEKSLDFYQNVLGFYPVRRPGSLNFDGAWLFNYGIGIHLLKSHDHENLPKKKEINPKDNHISFQCESMFLVENRLKELDIPYVKCRVEEGSVFVDQLFFHDPDGFMIEICNCDNIPVIPLVIGEPVPMVCKRVTYAKTQQQQKQPASYDFLQKAVHVAEEPQIHCA